VHLRLSMLTECMSPQVLILTRYEFPPNAEWLYVSGQIPVDEEGEVVGVGDLKTQIGQVFANLDATLHSAALDFATLSR